MLQSRWSGVHQHTTSETGIVATRLCTHRAHVDRENAEALAKLPGTGVVFRATDHSHGPNFCSTSSSSSSGGSGGRSFRDQLDTVCPAPRELTLKIGAQVILLRTLDQATGLVNGARGIVTRFAGVANTPTIRFAVGVEVEVRPCAWSIEAGGRAVATRRQLPLDLAWATSIHKAQGTSLDYVDVDLSRVFEAGQAYVALSRARTLAGLTLMHEF